MIRGGNFSVYFVFSRPVQIGAGSTLTIRLDSGVVELPCSHDSSGDRVFCGPHYVRTGDYDFDNQLEIGAGALNLTSIADLSDSTVTWAIGDVGDVPAADSTVSMAFQIWGGDEAVELRVSPQSLQEGVGPTPVTITARDRANLTRTASLDVPIAFVSRTATAADYTVTGPLSITIPAGALEAGTTVTVTPVDDLIKEARTELLLIEGDASMPSNFVRGVDLQIIDGPGIVLSVSPESIGEGDAARQVTVTAALGSSGDQVRPRAIPVTLRFGGTAVEADDFTLSGTRVVTIPANQRSASTTLTLTPVDDLLLEMAETIAVDGTTPGLTVEGTALTLLDNDELPQVILEVDDDTIREEEPATAVSVTARLHPSVMVSADVVVTLDLGGTATAGASGDYSASWSPAARQLTIPSGTSTSEAPVTLTLTPHQDSLAEGDESIVVEGTAVVSDPQMGALAVVVAPITLGDDDIAGVVLTPTALDIEEGGTATYTAVLESQPAGNVTFGMTAVLKGEDVSVAPVVLTFTTANWSAPQTVTVTTTSDEDRNDEVVTLTHTVRGGGYDGVPVDDVVVTILETARLPLTLGVSPYVIDEEGGVSTVTVSSIGAVTSESDETIALSFTGTATRGVDYLVGSETLVLAAGETSVATTVTGVYDAESEGSESIVVRASRDGRAVGAQVITLTDAVPPVVTLVLSPASVSERGGVSTVSATLSHATGADMTVALAAAAVSPAVAADFELSANRVLTIEAGSTESTTATLTALYDRIKGPDKEVTVSGTVTGGRGAADPAPVTLTIRDFGPKGRVRFVLSPSSVSENGGVSTLTATLDPPAARAVVMWGVRVTPQDYATSDDFELVGDRLRIRPGETTSHTSVTITAVDNDVDEAPDKTFLVGTQSFSGQYALGPRLVTLTIEDDDPTPTVGLVLSPSTIYESPVDGNVSTVTATLSRPSNRNVRVTLAAEAVPPAVSGDFELDAEVTLRRIFRGETTSRRGFTITAVDDDVHSADKEVTVSATVSGGNGVSAPAPQTLTIEETDRLPVLRMELSRSSIDENGGVSEVDVRLVLEGVDATVSSEAIEATVSVTPVSPAVSADFALSGNRVLTIPARQGLGTGTVTITAVDNDVDAADKKFTVSVSVSGGNGVGPPPSRTLTITDDDELPTVSLALTPDSIGENGGVSAVTAALSHPSGEAVEVTVSAAPVSPAVAGDFDLSSNTVLTIAAGSKTSTGTVTITAEDNDTYAPDKEVTVSATVSGGGGVSAPSSRTLTIEEDEGAPTVSLVLTPASVSEAGGVSTVTATLSHASKAPAEVTVSAAAVSPAVSGDFELSSNTVLTIAAGSKTSTGTVTITAGNNDAYAPDKQVTVSATVSGGGGGVSAPSSVTLTIEDDEEPPTVSLALDPASVSEAGGVSTVTATLSHASSASVAVTVSAAPVSPAVAGDFDLSSNTVLTIAAGSTTSTGTVTITAENNEVDAPDKQVTVSASVTEDSGLSAPSSATLTIADDEDTPTVSLALDPASVSEAGGVSTVTATLSGVSSASVAVTVSAAAVSPAVAGDFALSANKVLTIAAGETTSTGTVTITAENNDVDAPDKQVTVSASVTGGNGVSAPSSRTLTITDDDSLPTVSLALGPTSVGENGGVSTVTATLSHGSGEAVAVTVSAAAVSPAVAGDFALSTNRVLTIAAGSKTSTGTVTITAENNDVDAPDKQVTVSASVTGGRGVSAPSSQTLAIEDDEDATVTLVLGPASVSEDGGVSTVTATLSHASSEQAVVTVSAAAVSPAVAGDFALSSNTVLTIAAGSKTSTGTVTITAQDNDVDASNKTVTVSATVSGGNGVSAPSSVTLTITDDEGAPTVMLVLGPASVSEDGGVSAVTATLSGVSSASVAVTVSAAAVSPAVAGDFALSSNKVLAIAAGETTSTGLVTITAENNDVDAPDKRVTVSASATGGNGVSAPASVTLTITDDESAPAVSLVLTPSSVSENGGVSAVTATLSGVSSASVAVTVSAAAVSPAVAGDFALSTNRVLTIAAGETTSTGTVTIAAENNDVDAPDKQVTVSASVTGGNGASAPSPATLTITDDETTPAASLALNPTSVGENGGVSTVTATLGRASSERVVVTVSAAAVSPAVAGDFALSSNKVLTIAAGSTTSTGTVTIAAQNDDVDGPDKQVTVSATASGGNGVPAPSSVTLTITDEDATPAVSLALAPSSIGENGGVSTVTATLSGESSEAVEVTVSGAAVSPAVAGDFALSSNKVLRIAAGETTSTGTVTIAARNDDVDGPDKSVTVSATVSGGNGVSAPSSVTLTIADDEAPPTVTLVLSPTSVGEDDGVSTVTASLSGASSESVTVRVSAAAVSPALSGDFALSANDVLQIAAGSRTSTGLVTITAQNNGVDAPDKSVTVSATVTGGRGVAAPASQTLTITDDEGAPTVTLVLSPTSVGEDAGVSTVTATLSSVSSEAVTVTVSATPVSPTVAGDFALSANKALTIAAGETTSTGAVTITAVDDTVDAPDKKVTVSGSVTGGNGVSAPASQTLTITDDEGAPAVSLVLTPSSIGENGGVSTVSATLSGASSAAVEVTVSAAAVSPAVAGDFELGANPVLTIAPGSTDSAGTVTIAAVDNTVDGPDKEVTVSASVTGGGVEAPASQTLTITDDEGASAVSLVLAPSSIGEDGGVSTVTAKLSVASGESVEVTVSAAPVSPAVAGDFELSPDPVLTITAGETESTGEVTIAAVDDAVDGPDREVTVSGSVSGGHGVGAPASRTLTIVDNEGLPRVTLVLAPSSIGENEGVSTVTATLRTVSSESVEVTVSAAPVSPAVAGDFELSADRVLTIAAGETASTGVVTITAVDNTEFGRAREVTVSGSVTAGQAEPPAPQTLTITEDEEPQGVLLSVEPEEVDEGEGDRTVRVTATHAGEAPAEETVLTVSVLADTADDDDFTPVTPFELRIPGSAAAGTASFTLTPVDDELAEGPETLEVTGSEENGQPVTPAVLTIVDDDLVAVLLSVEPSTVGEGAGATGIVVTATLTGGTRLAPVVVTVTVSEKPEQYAVDQAVFDVEIPPGETQGTGGFLLTPVDDDEEESDEQVMVTGTTNPLAVEAAAVTIRDDDENAAPAFDRRRYVFDLPENLSGRETPVVLGTVVANDADGDRLRYVLESGDRDRFRVGRGDGSVSYVGEGEDFEADAPEYELAVEAYAGEAYAEVEVLVRVVDVSEAPEAADDRAETPEDTPKVIDVLANDSDPDGDRLRVRSVTAPEHGTAAVVSGGLRYEPELNWYGEDSFSYTVADAGGLTSKATVTVTVTPVNDPPEAVDDEAETLEDVPAVVDVLANDTDVDGDPLEVVAVGAASHGTTAVVPGGVRYASVLNWYGTDRFTYTIADPGGLTSTATVTMTVHPVNDPPEAVGVIPDQSIEEGGPPATLDLTPYFTDVDGDPLTYTAVSSDETAVTTSVSGSTLTLTAVVTGSATVTVTAADVEGLTATQTFGVRVGDRLVREVLTDTLAGLGRGHLSSARMAIGRRLQTGGGGMTRLMVAGQQLSLDAWNRMGGGGLQRSHEMLFRAATLRHRSSAADLVGTSADPRLRRPGAAGLAGGFGGIDGGRDRLLQGTDVLLSFGEQDAGASGGGGRRWTVWGQGDMQTFRGARSEQVGYDGALRTAYLGMDAQLSERWLAGVAVARSGGSGDWRVGPSSGRLATELTVVHPYLRWGGRDTAVWALAGIGRGTARNQRLLVDRRGDSPLSLGLGLLEGRRRVATLAGGIDVALRGEASWARLRTGAGDETVDSLEAGVRRLRTGVEVTLPLGAPGGLTLAPFGALSTRHDGGAGQTGVGLEMAGGLRVTGRGVRIEAQGRMLALHTATDYEERGVSVTATVGGGAYQPGLSASLRPHWGAQGVGAESLWQDHFQQYAQGPARDDAGVDARVGYGMRLAGGRLITPFGGYGQMAGGRRLRVGANLGLLGLFSGDFGSPVQVEFTGERYGRPGAPPDHRVSLYGIVNFGARPRSTCDQTPAACAAAGVPAAAGPGPPGGGSAELPPAP